MMESNGHMHRNPIATFLDRVACLWWSRMCPMHAEMQTYRDILRCFFWMRRKSIGNFVALIVLAVSCGSVTAASKEAAFASEFNYVRDEAVWLIEMSKRAESQLPDQDARLDFLQVVLDESKRAGLNPQLVLSVVDVASGFNKYAVAPGGGRGYMQVPPFWPSAVGPPDANLFHLRTNIRYGCALLRYLLDIEKGDLMKALGRYGSQMGGVANNAPIVVDPDFPTTVERLTKTRWRYDG